MPEALMAQGPVDRVVMRLAPRIVSRFSCGAASAVATKLALAEFRATRDVQIINAFIAQEHPDNRRFLDDCEGWPWFFSSYGGILELRRGIQAASCVGPGKSNLPFELRRKAGDGSRVTAGPIDLI